MAGSAEEYEKMALASMRRASESGGDPKFHHARAQIFATLAAAAASQGTKAADDEGPASSGSSSSGCGPLGWGSVRP